MLYALIAPEFVVLWAWRQLQLASKKPKNLKGVFYLTDLILNEFVKVHFTGWSRTHGFFAAMGGFVLYDGNKPTYALSLEDIEDLVGKDEIDLPIVSKEEIWDKSKGNAAAKGIALVQATWFLFHCASRAVHRLPITPLELVTAAFVLLNSITYALWWDKPFNVNYPVCVMRKHVCGPSAEEKAASGEKEVGWKEREAAGERFKSSLSSTRKMQDQWSRVRCGCSRREVREGVAGPLRDFLAPFFSMATHHVDDETFFAGKNEDDKQAVNVRHRALMVSILFGAIHCIAWSFSFPSLAELTSWRVSSIAITTIPPFMMALHSIPEGYFGHFPVFGQIAVAILFVLLPILYIFARVSLLILPFMALSSLPPVAFQTIHWTNLLPHV
jgi:hypothetical protein